METKKKNFFYYKIAFLTLLLIIQLVILTIIASEVKTKSLSGNKIEASTTQPLKQIKKNVLVVVYDPIRPEFNNQKLSEYKNWNNSVSLSREIVRFFDETTNGRIQYTIRGTIQKDLFIPKEEGDYLYSTEEYLECIKDTDKCYKSDYANYNWIIDQDNLCSKVNSGEIDEIWLFGGPWFGFYESRLMGPNGFWYNSGPLEGTTCNKLVPIMGFNYERNLDSAIHDYGHRTESTMQKVYGSWNKNSINHEWNKFALVDFQSSSYNYSGCGNTHYPPNGADDYDYSNTRLTNSYCNLFPDTKNKDDLDSKVTHISCNDWNCNELGYLEWWFNHMPNNPGKGSDGKLNDWWAYVIDPNIVISNNIPSIWEDYEYKRNTPTVTQEVTPVITKETTTKVTDKPKATNSVSPIKSVTPIKNTSIRISPTTSHTPTKKITGTSTQSEENIDYNLIDYDRNDSINTDDFKIFVACYKDGTVKCDTNMDKTIDLYDFIKFREVYLFYS